MNIRIKSPFLWAFFFFIFPIFLIAFDIQGVWITRWDLYSKDYIIETIDSLEKANITDAFVQVYGNGEAYFNSVIAPKKYNDFDPLKIFIDYAHKKGIHVHAWVNLLYMWDRRELTKNNMHIVNRYPQSVLVDDKGKSLLAYSPEEIKRRNIEGIFVSPASQYVNDYMILLIEEIARNYNVDGIHLDYCRYPGKEFIYDINLKNNFFRIYTIYPESLNTFKNIRIFGNGIDIIKQKYKEFPKYELNKLIKDIYLSVKEINPNIDVSAAVFANVKVAENNLYQNWWEWIFYDYIDFVIIMAYSPSLNILKKQMEAIKGKVNLDKLVIGLATYNQSLYNVRNNRDYLYSLYNDIKGFCLFSNKSIMDDKGYTYVGQKIFRNNEE